LPVNTAAELDELRATYKRLYFSEDKIKYIEKLENEYGFKKERPCT
jgi:hypothetical protein